MLDSQNNIINANDEDEQMQVNLQFIEQQFSNKILANLQSQNISKVAENIDSKVLQSNLNKVIMEYIKILKDFSQERFDSFMHLQQRFTNYKADLASQLSTNKELSSCMFEQLVVEPVHRYLQFLQLKMVRDRSKIHDLINQLPFNSKNVTDQKNPDPTYRHIGNQIYFQPYSKAVMKQKILLYWYKKRFKNQLIIQQPKIESRQKCSNFRKRDQNGRFLDINGKPIIGKRKKKPTCKIIPRIKNIFGVVK
ncbi:hypothetical protein FGO68_gene12636 [Halteria grandinella]|uniref:Uncharacterized protein n=1 Tax=Halteria grandinella TaxID=5974 RepID=A0A8J8NEG6_HALGN|nr:hypothetical protein FGO68_gene12636 [Halteria grandinella]